MRFLVFHQFLSHSQIHQTCPLGSDATDDQAADRINSGITSDLGLSFEDCKYEMGY